MGTLPPPPSSVTVDVRNIFKYIYTVSLYLFLTASVACPPCPLPLQAALPLQAVPKILYRYNFVIRVWYIYIMKKIISLVLEGFIISHIFTLLSYSEKKNLRYS